MISQGDSRMIRKCIAKALMCAIGLVLISTAALALPLEQGQARGLPAAHGALPASRSRKATRPSDDFAGLKFTADQQTKIDKIHQDIALRIDNVQKDAMLGPEQKDAMLAGYRRMEKNEIFQVLSPEQQKEVRRRARARRTEEHEQERQSQNQPQPH